MLKRICFSKQDLEGEGLDRFGALGFRGGSVSGLGAEAFELRVWDKGLSFRMAGRLGFRVRDLGF